MRRASTCLAVLGLSVIALALPSFAAATPVVTFKAKAVPHPNGLQGHGEHPGRRCCAAGRIHDLGHRIRWSTRRRLKGSTSTCPRGRSLHPTGFPTCPEVRTRTDRPGTRTLPQGLGWPVRSAKSRASSPSARKSCEENRPSNPSTPRAAASSSSPTATNRRSWKSSPRANTSSASGLYSHELIASIPLVETVPGADDASVKSISVKVGSAYKSKGKTIYYGRLPKKCPKGGFPLKTEVHLRRRVGGLERQVVSKTYKAPCPSKK